MSRASDSARRAIAYPGIGRDLGAKSPDYTNDTPKREWIFRGPVIVPPG
jgi:hypothetical protein